MPLTGKYDFKGLQRAGVAAIKAALASTTWGASIVTSVWFKAFAPLEDKLLELAINWLANKGLVVLNLGAIFIEGEFDQKNFDAKMEEALKKVEQAGGKLTPEQMKAIDDEVIKAFRKFALITGHN